jgi:two-component system, NtrC family, sensor kinase
MGSLSADAERRRCKRITGGLLGLARTVPEEQLPVSLPELVKEIFATLKPQKLFREISMEFFAASELSPLIGDRDRLRQVLVNLSLNAAQAMNGRGALQVAAAQEDAMCILQVRDTGPGVPQELRQRIFEPFVTTKGRDEGTGLGLPLCRKLIEDHHGRIDLEPSDSGACFRLSFPLPEREKYFDKNRDDSLG